MKVHKTITIDHEAWEKAQGEAGWRGLSGASAYIEALIGRGWVDSPSMDDVRTDAIHGDHTGTRTDGRTPQPAKELWAKNQYGGFRAAKNYDKEVYIKRDDGTFEPTTR
jgi:hypothetical protein